MGQILDVIDGSGNDDVLVMLSTDHGGEGWLHGRNQDSDLIIPVFIKGQYYYYNSQCVIRKRNTYVTIMVFPDLQSWYKKVNTTTFLLLITLY